MTQLLGMLSATRKLLMCYDNEGRRATTSTNQDIRAVIM